MRRSFAGEAEIPLDFISRKAINSSGSTLVLNAAHFAEALKEYGKSKALRDGRRLHSLLLVRYGALLPTLLSDCLVQMYGLCGCPQDAQKSFDAISNPSNISWTVLIRALGHNGEVAKAQKSFFCMRDPDTVTWNAMIGVYAKNRHSQNAMNLFAKMQLHGPAPSVVTFVCIIDACCDLQTGFVIHSLVIMFCHESNTTVCNALITMYGRCHDVLDGKSTFSKMKARNLVTWSALISQCSQNENPMDAIQMFCEMLHENIMPNNITCISVLDACATLGKLEDGWRIHNIVIDCGYDKNIPVSNALVNSYGKCGSLQDAKSVFCSISGRNMISWSSLMGACAKASSYKEVLQVFHQMQCDNVRPDEVTFLHVLDACTGLTDLEAGQEIHASILESGYTSVIALGNALINFYGKCGDLSHARSVFINLNPKNVISWSTLISIFAQNGHRKEALNLFLEMQTAGIKPNNITLVGALDACSTTAEGHILHTFLVSGRYESSATVQTAIVNLYDKVGSYTDAMCIFSTMTEKDVISWTSGIAACAHAEHGREALNLFYQMLDRNVEPNSVTFVCVLDGCSSLAALDEGKELHAAIIDSGCDDDQLVANTLINMYGKCGNALEAVGVFWGNTKRDSVSWSAVLSACALNGQAAVALNLFDQMQALELKPNEAIFLCILTSCSHGGLIEQGLRHFSFCTRWHGLLPAEEHVACVIDLYGRAGQLEVAEQLLELIPFARAVSALASLLGACRFHGDGDRGLRCARSLLDIDPDYAASYVDCANLYVAATLWE